MVNEAPSSLKDTTGQLGRLDNPEYSLERLANTHQRMLLEESSIVPNIAAERAYWTATRRSEIPEAFKPYQRRAPALILPTYSPDRETTGAQIRPDNPRKDKKGKPIKYESASGSHVILDVHPKNMEDVQNPDVDLWVTEGVKKGDSLTSRGLCAVSLIGVWGWCVPGSQHGSELLPCWDHVALAGRKVFIVFDSDVMSKPEVQVALERLVQALEVRRADTRVVYLSGGDDNDKVGVDDYLAAGGTVKELKMLARKFETADIGEIRTSRDEKLRAAVVHLWRRWQEGDWMRFAGKADKGNWARGHTARDVMEALIELAMRNGKWDGRGAIVRVGLRRLAELSAKSAESVRKAVAHLEADGQIEILPSESEGKARKYRLLVDRATLDIMEGDTTREGFLGGSTPGCQPLRAPTAPRLRWSSPGRPRRKEFELVPGRCVVRHAGASLLAEHREASPYVKRLGPHRGAVLDILEAAGGEMHLEDLCEALHRKRPRDVRRRILKPLVDAGIIECEGEVVSLSASWLAILEKERERAGEVYQAERQAKKHREESARYREYLKREKRGTPEASLAAVRRTQDLRERRLREIRDEQELDRAPTPPAVEALVAKVLGQQNRVRMGLLCGVAMDEGLRWRDVPPAVRRMGYRVERLPEYGNEEFVFARGCYELSCSGAVA